MDPNDPKLSYAGDDDPDGATPLLYLVVLLPVVYTICILVFGFNELFLYLYLPVAISSPNIYNNILTITVININGTNTIIQDIILIPPSHNTFNKMVHNTITMHFINAVLYNPLSVSNIICVTENTRYIKLGAHNLNIEFILR